MDTCPSFIHYIHVAVAEFDQTFDLPCSVVFLNDAVNHVSVTVKVKQLNRNPPPLILLFTLVLLLPWLVNMSAVKPEVH